MISKKTLLLGLTLFSILLLIVAIAPATAQTTLTPIEELGSFLYFDEDLSEPSGQSCASCHDPAFGFVDPDFDLPVSEGVIAGLFGVRGRRGRSSDQEHHGNDEHRGRQPARAPAAGSGSLQRCGSLRVRGRHRLSSSPISGGQ